MDVTRSNADDSSAEILSNAARVSGNNLDSTSSCSLVWSKCARHCREFTAGLVLRRAATRASSVFQAMGSTVASNMPATDVSSSSSRSLDTISLYITSSFCVCVCVCV